MTTAAMRRLGSPWALFAATHLLLAALAPFTGFGDVTEVYQGWFRDWAQSGVLVGVQSDWVYPVLALLPILLAGALPGAYLLTWLLLVTALDAVAYAAVLRRSRRAATWWMVLLLALGPVSLARLDSIAAPLAIIALLHLADRPRFAAALLALAAWIKVWPAAVLVAALLRGPRRPAVALAAAGTTVAVLCADAAFGGIGHVLSFLAQQSQRGIELEAPIGTPLLWLRVFGLSDARVVFDPRMLDPELVGPGVTQLASASTLAMALVVVGIVVHILRRPRDGRRQDLAGIVLALVLALIALNKVGSPQYVTWLAAPVVLGLIEDPARSRRLAARVLLVALLTQLWVLPPVLALGPVSLLALTARNALEVVLLVQAVASLRGGAGERATSDGRTALTEVPLG
ncbi:glycosyltransferase 87 family protein [Amnibacterium sp. CER49]|uniref:glycosyltransferase 87 family protein n=1 Tax=Amnibacterium sp. CER49 TaxID=3039161 RepID=UPI002446A538|nr:glycosyltransferase 87 family protein [Amnibacterium sp. CER49]MDH2444377.1 glycosyltransferase 87 family protein [Amnibacterium sp. CER49]